MCSLQRTCSPWPNSQTLPHRHTQKGAGGGANNAEEWTVAKARTSRRKRLPPKPEVPLQNRFTTLQAEEESPVTPGEVLELSNAAPSGPCITASTTKKR